MVLAEPIVVETEPAGRRPRPTGFWRGTAFYRIVRILERRWERGESRLRVLADRGCFDLRRVTDVDPWTWRTEGRWELTADSYCSADSSANELIAKSAAM